MPREAHLSIEWIAARSIPEPNTGCWLWLGGNTRNGYGASSLNRKPIGAHRLSYLARHGSLPIGMDICHRCDVRACVNPDHLWAGTRRENIGDMFIKGRAHNRAGSNSATAVLNEADVVAIRKALQGGAPPLAVARAKGVSRGTIYNIRHGRTWRHVKEESK